MATTTLIDHQNVSIATGTQEFGPADIPSTVTNFTIRLARHTTATPTFWPNAITTIDAKLFLSNDGGVTFPRGAGGFTSVGGTLLGKGGVGEIPETVFSGTIPIPVGVGWKIKAVVIVGNGPLVSQLTIQVA
jgi:hypothetical protein